MIQEAFCSYEVSKKLSNDGFDEPCSQFYNSLGQRCEGSQVCKYSNSAFVKTFSECIAAPTHQMALAWLREYYNLHIIVYALSLGWYFEVYDLLEKDITGCKPLYKVGIPNKEDVFDTFESATDAAIEWCLDNYFVLLTLHKQQENSEFLYCTGTKERIKL